MNWLQTLLKKHWFLLATISIYVCISGFFINQYDLWRDEAFSVNVAQMPVAKLVSTVSRDVHPPLHLVLLKSWMLLFGTTAVAVRSLSVLFGVVTIALSYQVIKMLINDDTMQKVTLALVATTPFVLYYGLEARVYTLLMASTVGFVLTTLQIFENPKVLSSKLNLGFIGAALSGLYGHVIFLFSMPVFVLWQLALVWKKVATKNNRLTAARPYILQFFKNYLVTGLLFLPWMAALLFQVRQVNTQGFWLSFNPVVDMVTSIGQFFVSNKVSQEASIISVVVVLSTITLGYSLNMISVFRAKKYFFIPLLTPVVLVTVALVSLHTPIYYIRYLTFLIPLISISTGLGLLVLSQDTNKRASVILGSILVVFQLYLFIGNSMQQPGLKAEYRRAISFIANEYPTATIIHPHGYTLHSFIYYSSSADLDPGRLYDPERDNPHFEGLAAFSENNYFNQQLGQDTLVATPYLGRDENFEQVLIQHDYYQIDHQLFHGGLNVAIWSRIDYQ